MVELYEDKHQPYQLHKFVVVTGFGPFRGHEEINASWEAVKLLPNSILCNGEEFYIFKIFIPVEYAKVNEFVYSIWGMEPWLVIHCGVRSTSKSINLELKAKNCFFPYPDNKKKFLRCGKARLVNKENFKKCHIATELNIMQIIKKITYKFNRTPCDCSNMYIDKSPVANVSYSAGNYLCNYVYLKSLDRDKKRTLFIHVPPIDKPFPSIDTARVIHFIIKQCLHQLQ